MTKRFQPLNKLQSRKERRKAAKLEKKKRIAYFHQLKVYRILTTKSLEQTMLTLNYLSTVANQIQQILQTLRIL